MSAIDMARGGRFTEADIDAPAAESPARPTMQPGDHLNAELFGGISTTSEPVATVPGRERRAHYIGGQTLADWRTSPASSAETETETKTTREHQ